MQTRSMTRKGLTRAASLEARPPPVVPHPAVQAPPPLEVVSSQSARVEHADEDTTMAVYEAPRGENAAQQQMSLVGDQEQQARAQHQLMSIVQAQANANAATQRNTEERIQQALVPTEARLHKTAEDLVRSHAHEQALETCRDLGHAIQIALVNTHSQAHAQAMVSAQDRLNQFTKDIRAQIQAQHASAVDEVSTRGVAYIKSQTEERLALLPQDVRGEIERSIERGLLTIKPEPGSASLTSDASFSELQRRLEHREVELPTQLAVSEKRIHGGAVSLASAQAEGIVAQVEQRILGQIEDRFSTLESQANEAVRAAIVGAETHCNVIEQRASENIKRAVDEFHSTRALRTETYVDRVLEIKLQATIQNAMTGRATAFMEEAAETTWKPLINRLVINATPALVERLVATKVQGLLDNYVALKVEERVQAVVTDVVPNIINRKLANILEPQVKAVTKTVVRDFINQHYDVSLRSRVEDIVVDRATHIIRQKFDDDIRQHVEKMVEASSAQTNQRIETLKREMWVDQVEQGKIQQPSGIQWPLPTAPWHVPQFQWPLPQVPAPSLQWPSPVVVATQPTRQADDGAAEMERQINQALALAYPTKTTKTAVTVTPATPARAVAPPTPPTPARQASNQDDYLISASDPVSLNPRSILAACMRQAVGDDKGSCTRFAGPEAPKSLSSLHPAEIQLFVTAYDNYESAGGQERWSAVYSTALLAYLRTIECDEGSSDDAILFHLKSKLIKANSDVKLIEKKFGEVKIDPEASSSLQRVQGILIGVETVLCDMGLKDSVNELGVAVPLETQMKIVMEKLPATLRTLVQKRLKYAPPMKTKGQFAALLFDEAKYFTWS